MSYRADCSLKIEAELLTVRSHHPLRRSPPIVTHALKVLKPIDIRDSIALSKVIVLCPVDVEGIRAQMNIEGIAIDPDEIWGDVRDRAPGR